MGKSTANVISLPTHKQIVQMQTVSIGTANIVARFAQLARKGKVKGFTTAVCNRMLAAPRQLTADLTWLNANEALYNQQVEGSKATSATKPATGGKGRTKAAGG